MKTPKTAEEILRALDEAYQRGRNVANEDARRILLEYVASSLGLAWHPWRTL